MISRRIFLMISTLMGMALMCAKRAFGSAMIQTIGPNDKDLVQVSKVEEVEQKKEMNESGSVVYHVSNGDPENNIKALLEMIGGIDKIISYNDIVILKPNGQWWNQGATNTDAMKAFIEAILDRPNFSGEIIIAENHHHKGLNSRGWTTEDRNGQFNLNELVDHFSSKGIKNVTKYHWQDAGSNPTPLEGTDGYGKRVAGAEDGDGYVWDYDNVYCAPNGHKCIMTYPIFTSTYSGITIDLKKGAWKNGNYLEDKNIKFINFSALNHHSHYCGATASIKNMMGVVDMTCGLQAPEPEGTYNVHFVGVEPVIRFSYLTRRNWGLGFLKDLLRKLAYNNFQYTGAALGHFMKTIRMPDLNIISADWVGWGSRIDSKKSAKPKALLASKDPVALDLVAGRDVLLKVTPIEESEYRTLNDPENLDGPFYKFIKECHMQGIGNMEKKKINIMKKVF